MSAPVPRSDEASPWRAGPYSDAVRSGCSPLFLRRADGRLLPLDVERWCAGADGADMTVLQRCEEAVLDIGCGPGRMLVALSQLGHSTLGIDVSPAAIARALGSGGRALHRCVFGDVPNEGRWGTALLMDGNVGIGGNPGTLLERVAEIVVPGGLLLAEAAPTDVDERFQVRIESGYGEGGASFPWAQVGISALAREARSAGWQDIEQWSSHGRSFIALRSTPRAT
ncbi:class I SAM-dependent methyltransferase [Streptomyces sp. NBC_00467]